MKKFFLFFLLAFVSLTLVAQSSFALSYSFASKYTDQTDTYYKWEPGPDSSTSWRASDIDKPIPSPGGATWSIVPEGWQASMGDHLHPSGTLSTNVLDLVNDVDFPSGNISSHFPAGTITSSQAVFWEGLNVGDLVPYELWAIDHALDQWAGVSGFENLGPVADGALGFEPADGWYGPNAANSNNGNLGDIRVAAYTMNDAFLGHAIPPGTETDFGAWENWGGDVHLSPEKPLPPVPGSGLSPLIWVNDESDISGDDKYTYDLYTNVLHEIGHSLGLGHPNYDDSDWDSSTVMTEYTVRGSAQRFLQPGDIAGIQAIYGAPSQPIPEPGTFLLLGGLIGFLALGRKKSWES